MPFGRNRESRSREAAGRRNWPEAVPRKMSGRKSVLTEISWNREEEQTRANGQETVESGVSPELRGSGIIPKQYPTDSAGTGKMDGWDSQPCRDKRTPDNEELDQRRGPQRSKMTCEKRAKAGVDAKQFQAALEKAGPKPCQTLRPSVARRLRALLSPCPVPDRLQAAMRSFSGTV